MIPLELCTVPKPPAGEISKKLPGCRVVGVMGRAGSGKDTLADYLRGQYGEEIWQSRWALADPVKKVAEEVLGIPYSSFVDRAAKEAVVPHLGFSPRRAAQLIGTEGMRGVFGGWVWVHCLHRKLLTSGFIGEAAVVTDIRFPEEVQWVLEQNGILVVLERIDAGAVAAHSSEQQMALEQIYTMQTLVGGESSIVHITNNGSIDDFYQAIRQQLVPLLSPAGG